MSGGEPALPAMTDGTDSRVPPEGPRLILTCEHGGRHIPAALRERFASPEAQAALDSHRGWDPGAAPLARELARTLGAPLLGCWTSRLVVDPNRSLGHPRLFSPFTRPLPRREREALVRRYWLPHRTRVESMVDALLQGGGPVLQLGIHTFTPVLDGRPRDMDVGVLYDPARPSEAAWADGLVTALRSRAPELRVRRNAPYRGTDDGLVTHLRRRFPTPGFAALELEVNQGKVAPGRPGARAFRRRMVELLARELASPPGGPVNPGG